METLGIPLSLGFLELVFNLVCKVSRHAFHSFWLLCTMKPPEKTYDSFDAVLPLDFIINVDC